MKPNSSFPATGCQKLPEMDNEHKPSFYEKHVAIEVVPMLWVESGRATWSKQGFPVKQDVLIWGWDLLLLSKGTPATDQELEKKSANLFGPANLSVLNLIIVKKERERKTYSWVDW